MTDCCQLCLLSVSESSPNHFSPCVTLERMAGCTLPEAIHGCEESYRHGLSVHGTYTYLPTALPIFPPNSFYLPLASLSYTFAIVIIVTTSSSSCSSSSFFFFLTLQWNQILLILILKIRVLPSQLSLQIPSLKTSVLTIALTQKVPSRRT